MTQTYTMLTILSLLLCITHFPLVFIDSSVCLYRQTLCITLLMVALHWWRFSGQTRDKRQVRQNENLGLDYDGSKHSGGNEPSVGVTQETVRKCVTKEFVKYPKANHSLTAGLQLSVYVSISARLPTNWGQGLCLLVGCMGYSRQSIHADWIEWVNIKPKYDHDHESINVLWFYLICDVCICTVCVHVGEWRHICMWPTARVCKPEDHLWCGFLPFTLFETGFFCCLFSTAHDRLTSQYASMESHVSASYLSGGALGWR